MYNATNTGKEANAYLILYITMLPIFENTNFTAVDDFLRLTILDNKMVKTGQFTTKCKGNKVIALKLQKSLWWDSA